MVFPPCYAALGRCVYFVTTLKAAHIGCGVTKKKPGWLPAALHGCSWFSFQHYFGKINVHARTLISYYDRCLIFFQLQKSEG